MQMSKRVRGSVSILLTLILLPMVTYATMIVDASRLQIARTNISGAGDLALNAMMSDYNEMLAEMYGLFANTTNEEDIQDVLAGYFQQTIEGRYLPSMHSEDGAYIQNIIHGLLSDTADWATGNHVATTELDDEKITELTDFLKMQLEDMTASAVTGSALANPNTMKRQIIEYMKYRGPLSIGSTLLGKLDYLKGSDQQVDACDNKVQYAEKLGQMQGPCLEIYNAITDKYNTGAVMMNELTGQQGVTAERDANGNWKEQTNHLLSGANTLITESDVNMQYATTFYLMDAMSPYYKWSSNHPDFFDYASLAGGKEAYTIAKKAIADSVCNGDVNALNSMLEADTSSASDGESEKDACLRRVRSNIEKLNAILNAAGTSCGYSKDSQELRYGFDTAKVKVVYKIFNSPTRTPTELNKYKVDSHNVRFSASTFQVNYPGKGKTDVIAPNLNRLTNFSDEPDGELNRPFKAFMTGGSDFYSHDFDNTKIDTSDNQFNDQIQKSFDVLKAQEDLQNSMKYGMEDAAKRQQRMQVLIDGYNNIWKQIIDDLQVPYQEKFKEMASEAMTTILDNQSKMLQWKNDIDALEDVEIPEDDEENPEAHKAYIDAMNAQAEVDEQRELCREFDIPDNEAIEQYQRHLENIDSLSWFGFRNVYSDLKQWEQKLEAKIYWYDFEKVQDEENRFTNIGPWCLPTLEFSIEYPDDVKQWAAVLNDVGDENGDGVPEKIDDLEMNYCALNRLKDTVFPGYKGAFNQYISTAVFNNKNYFQNYGTAYADESISGLIGLAATLETMKEGLTFASGKLQTLHDMFTGPDGLNAKQSTWKNSIDAINSDSSRAAMTSDFNTLTDQFSLKEVDQLKELIDNTILPKVTQAIANVKGITYMNIQLVQVDGNGKTLSEMHNKDDIEGKIKDKLWQSKYYNAGGNPTDEPHKVAQQATKTMWNTVSASDSTIKFKIPSASFIQNEDIKKNADALKDKLTDLDAYKKIAIDLVKGFDTNKNPISYAAGGKYNYDSMCGTKDGKIDYLLLQDAFKHFQILDGLIDDKGSTYTGAEWDKAKTGDMQDAAQKDSKSVEATFMDDNEALMVALYAEAKAAKTSSEQSSESGESKSVDNLTASAQQTIDDSQKEETPAPAEGESLAHVDIATIMDNVQNYCQNKENQSGVNGYGTPPAMKNASVKKGKDAGKSSGGGALKAAKELLAQIANIGDKVVENLYLEEYFTEMFTCRTDNQNLNKLTAEKDKNALPVIMMNGFGNEAAKPGAARTLNTKTEWYGKEVEYLLWGNNNLDTNLAYTDGMIFAIRFALNAIYAFTAVDIQTYALELATAIAGWTVIGVPIVQVCITILIALAESGYDLYLLHDGREVPIYKNQATFVCSPTGMLKTVATEVVTQITDEVIESCTDKIEEKLNSEVDNFVKEFNGLVDDASKTAEEKAGQLVNKLEGTITEFTDKQADAIKSGVREQFITPVINKLVAVANLAEISEIYQEINPSELVTKAVDDAFAEIENNIKGINGSIGTICQELLERGDVIETLKSDIKTELNTYVSKLDEQANKVFNIDDMLYKKLGGYVDEAIGKVNKEINDEVAKASDYIKKQFKNKVTAPLSDKAKETAQMTAETAKGYISETMDQATAMLTGQGRATAEGLIDTMPNGNPVDTNASSGVTLTYKEYCKILMILFVSINQDQVLQRAAVLIQANMSNLYESNPYKEENAGFDITKANTLFSLNAKIRMATLFPWPARDELNEANMNGGLQLDFNEIHTKTMTINYCGVNGY